LLSKIYNIHGITKVLTSRQNPLVKQVCRLHQAKGRREQGVFLLEGKHLIEEAMRNNYPLSLVFCTEYWQAKHLSLWQSLQSYAERLELVSDQVLGAIATTVNPDGIVAVAPRVEQKLIEKSINNLGLVLETIQDPGNFGTILRTAVSAGVEGLWVSEDSVDLDHPKVLRASSGAWFQMPMGVSENLSNTIEQYKKQGFQILATVPSAQLSYWQVDMKKPTILLLGNEGGGLSQELINLADQQVQIPLSNSIESLNVAICTALILFEAKRQRNL
jgi:TrmH family RNA methyltransferase